MIKKLFIPVEYNFKYEEIEKIKSKLLKKFKELKTLKKSNVALVYSIQFRNLADEIKKTLEKNTKIKIFRQILGCTPSKSFKSVDVIILISNGRFHAVSLAYETKLPVYLIEISDSNLKITKISKKDTEIIEKKQKASYVKFLNSKNIGIIVSLKPGQNKIKKAFELKKQLQKQNKIPYLFLCNNINFNEFENFSGIEFWINTACPRLDIDFRKMNLNVINLNDLKVDKSN